MPEKPRTLFVAMVSSLPGEEEVFEAWYDRHLLEIDAVPGIVSMQRYRYADRQLPGQPEPPRRNLALYELDGDPMEVMEEIARRRREGEWSPREGIDESSIAMWVYEPVIKD